MNLPLLHGDLGRAVPLGILATATMDAWLIALRWRGVPTLDFALIGRWVGHLSRGRWSHARIGAAAPVRGERAIGWLTHYAVGIAFAFVWLAAADADWWERPRLLPALAFGAASVAAPWLVMQPAMGAGVAAARTPTPWRNRLRSLSNHLAFGAGLYLAARLIPWSP